MQTNSKQSRQKLYNQPETQANQDSGLWIKAAKTVIYAGKRISHAAKVLYVILRDYQGENEYAWPSVATLATDMECSERYVQELLRELEAVGAIEIIEQAGWVSLYRVCFLELKSGQPTSDQLPRLTQAVSVPPNYSSPLPPNYSSPELEPLELEKRVCENAVKRSNSEGGEGDIPQLALTTEVPTNPQDPPIRDKTPKPKRGYANIEARFNARPILGDRDNGQNREQEVGAGSRSRKPEQVLSSTETHTQPAVGDYNGQLTTEQTDIAELLKAVGMATLDACRLAVQPQNHRAHVQAWIVYARGHAHNPAGYLCRVLDRQDAQPPAPKKVRKATTRRATSKQTDQQTPPIDFTKYAPGGKYGYLTSNDQDTQTQTAEEYLDLNNFDNSGQELDQAEPPTPTAPPPRIWIKDGCVIRPARVWENYSPSQVVPDPYAPPIAAPIQSQTTGVTS